VLHDSTGARPERRPLRHVPLQSGLDRVPRGARVRGRPRGEGLRRPGRGSRAVREGARRSLARVPPTLAGVRAVERVFGVRGSGGGYRRKRRLRRAIVGFAIAAGVSLLLVFGPNKNKAPEHFSAIPATHAPRPLKAKFTSEERNVAVRFI